MSTERRAAAGTTPCRYCDEPVRLITAAGGRVIALDPTSTVYVREPDGEGGACWAPDPGILAQHRCANTNGGMGR